ncbi:MAG: amidohydrolase family protein [Christensenellales bacterium]|jgi:predicted TIM-barrel fold metal-dependent hydrolase
MIIDAHMHLGVIAGVYNYDTETDSLLDTMDRLGIGFALSSHNYAIGWGNLVLGAELSIQSYYDTSGRIVSYHVYDPRDSRESIKIMEQYHDPKIFRGIKIHPSFHYTDASDERYRPVYEWARTRKLPILTHSWTLSQTNPKQKYSLPSAFEKYIIEYPDVTLILGHSGGRYRGICEAVQLGQKYPNVMFDTAGDIHISDLVEYLVDSVGDDRVLYGSDYSMMDQRTMLGAVIGASIPYPSKEKILCGNALRIFGLSG